jgi:ubiquinone/menaquinone biosynthesis C-methylase UbiE
MRWFCILPLLIFLCCGQDGGAAQKLVENLYPKNDGLKEARIGEIVRLAGIREGSVVADVGCGPGEVSVILSHIVGTDGKVYCEDISEEKHRGLPAARANLKKQRVKNVTTIHGNPDNPRLPPRALDVVLIINAYHEMPQYALMLQHIRESLKPEGRLIIWDNRPNRTINRPREKQCNNHVLSADFAAGELQTAGFRITGRKDAFVDNPDSESAHWLITATAP